jgi:outer membrane protein
MRLNRIALALTTALLAPPALLAGAAGPARAQSLQEALALAYANSPTLLSARAQLRVVDENVPQALAGWRPTVQISSAVGWTDSQVRAPGFSTQFGQQVAVGTNLNGPVDTSRTIGQNSIVVTQPLFRGGRTVAQTRRAENQVLAQRASLYATEQQVLQDSVTAYVNVVRDQEQLLLQINNEQVLTEQLRATNERFRVGEITRTDVAQAESRLASAKAQRAVAEGNLQISRATFQRQIGQPPRRLVAPQPLRPPVRSAAEAAQLAVVNNPNVISALFNEASARDNVDIQMSALMPQLSIQGQAFRTDNNVQPNTRTTGTQATFNLTVPIYQGGAEYSLVRQARQQAVQQRQVLADQQRQVAQQATQAWEQLQSSRAQVESVRAAIRASEIALDGVQREAIVGSRTTLDVLNAEQELLTNRTNLVQALATVVSQSFVLASAVGRLTAQDLGLPVDIYDMRSYYLSVRNRWLGLGDGGPAAEAALVPELLSVSGQSATGQPASGQPASGQR